MPSRPRQTLFGQQGRPEKGVVDGHGARRGIIQELKLASGATSVEYAVMLAGIAALVIVTVFALGLSTEGLFDRVTGVWP
jgi:Flp pilus assembly pilin Flp